MDFTKLIQLSQSCLNLQGTIKKFSNANRTSKESHSSHNLSQRLSRVVSRATIMLNSSASRAEKIPMKLEKAPKQSPRASLNIPPIAANPGDPKAPPSQLHFMKPCKSACQSTCLGSLEAHTMAPTPSWRRKCFCDQEITLTGFVPTIIAQDAHVHVRTLFTEKTLP
ncbi:hypothetical protein Fmac_012309 [Flemingia macrophylla]|uniref:Uncharacterized protein n=1 Tax=Flemingia macrophylla TaxID=520843 RepID=A0ABD1MQS8_9FABA